MKGMESIAEPPLEIQRVHHVFFSILVDVISWHSKRGIFESVIFPRCHPAAQVSMVCRPRNISPLFETKSCHLDTMGDHRNRAERQWFDTISRFYIFL